MTANDKTQFFELFKQWEKEELDCEGNCNECYYRMESPDYCLDNCPILVVYDMIYRKIYDIDVWNKRKG